MGNPHDFKPAILGIKDPGSDIEASLLDPSSAMVTGEAIGHNARRTGVYGHSERSVGVYGKSPIWAGFFEGDVQIAGQLSVDSGIKLKGDLNVAGHIRSQDFDKLNASFFNLRNAFAALEAGIAKERATFRGVRIDSPLARPTLSIDSVNVASNGGNANVAGLGYRPGPVWVFVFDITKNQKLTVQNGANALEDLAKSPFLAAGPMKDLNFQVQFQGADKGDKLAFSVTDGTPDLNDLTQLLWSEQVVINVV